MAPCLFEFSRNVSHALSSKYRMRLSEITQAPLVLFHASPSVITRFHALTHFGTEKAARQRLRDRRAAGFIYEVEVEIQNPLRVSDAEASDEAALLHAIKRGRYPHLDLGIANRDGAPAAVAAAGYDGLVYQNDMEDRGRLSYVILGPDQAAIVGRTALDLRVPKRRGLALGAGPGAAP